MSISNRPFSIASRIMLLVVLIFGAVAAGTAPASAATYNSSEATCRSSRPTLRTGDKGTCVQVAQQLLTAKGVFNRTATTPSTFGPATTASTIAFQHQSGLVQDGVIGPKTWAALLGGTSTPSTAARPASASGLPASCRKAGKTICIVKASGSHAKLYAVQTSAGRSEIVRSMNVRTGDARGSNYVTTTGGFSVGRRYVDYTSKAYDAPMPHSLFFNGGQAIHYSPDFAARGYDGGASHGCVNIGSRSDAKWLYEWSPLHTRVVVTR